MIEVIMPKLGLTMEEGTLLRWLKSEGEDVGQGDPLFEVQTDKVTMEAETPASGTLGKVLVSAGETVPITQVIAYILALGRSHQTSGRFLSCWGRLPLSPRLPCQLSPPMLLAGRPGTVGWIRAR